MSIELSNDEDHHPTKSHRITKFVCNRSFTRSFELTDLGWIEIRFSYLVSNKHGRFDAFDGDKRIRAIFGYKPAHIIAQMSSELCWFLFASSLKRSIDERKILRWHFHYLLVKRSNFEWDILIDFEFYRSFSCDLNWESFLDKISVFLVDFDDFSILGKCLTTLNDLTLYYLQNFDGFDWFLEFYPLDLRIYFQFQSNQDKICFILLRISIT